MATQMREQSQKPCSSISAPLVPAGVLLWLLASSAAALAGDRAAPELARELAAERDHAGAALEYRRLALEALEPAQRGGYFWASAFEYLQAGDAATADRLLSRVESETPDLARPTLLLRTDVALAAGKWEEAAFFADGVLQNPAATPEEKKLAARRLAAAELRAGDPAAARAGLQRAPEPAPQALGAVNNYAQGRDKQPWLGGVLGIVPGLGYFYAGEWANGLRSLILNGVFIFGMVNTAQHNEWGAFAPISFFEVTWYTGSIYGGVDASYRYNRERLDGAVNDINGPSGFMPDPVKLPLVSLHFSF